MFCFLAVSRKLARKAKYRVNMEEKLIESPQTGDWAEYRVQRREMEKKS